MHPALGGRDFHPPFFTKTDLILLEAHQHRATLRGGVEEIGAFVTIQVGDAQSCAASLRHCVTLRRGPLASGLLQQNHELCLCLEAKVIPAVSIQVGANQGLSVFGD